MSGWFAVKRGLTSHPAFRGDFAKIGIFLWMMENAAWKDTTIDVAGKPHTVPRGSLCYSQRFMAVKFGISVKALRTFLSDLEEYGVVKVSVVQKGNTKATKRTQVTLCNYEKYQSPGNKTETSEKQDGNKEEQGNNKQPSPPSEETPPADFSLITKFVWDEGKRLLSRHDVPNPGRVIGKWLKTSEPADLLSAIDAAHKAQTHDPVPYITAALSSRPAAANDVDRVMEEVFGRKAQ